MIIPGNSILPIDMAPDATATWFLVGIGGSGMRSFAEMLADAGNHVIGMDGSSPGSFRNRLNARGKVDVIPWNQSPDWRLWPAVRVVYSLAVSPLNPVLADARRNGVSVQTLPQALGGFLRPMQQICVAGTHGKTTTAGMIWWILHQAGQHPAGFVGGELCGDPTAATLGHGRISVVESCEYRESFLELNPQTVVLTGIEPDHFDYFQDDRAADLAYIRFAEKSPADGVVIVCSDSPRAINVARSSQRPVVSYSLHGQSDWHVSLPSESSRGKNTSGQVTSTVWKQRFELRSGGRTVAEVRLPIPGLHNVSNAVAAIIAAQMQGVPFERAADLISTFPGIRRRFEHRGTWNGIDLIDDYAHHPTAIAATLNTARATFPRRRILAVFEPHQISRTERLFGDFADALSLADECMVLPVLPARECASAASCCRLAGRLVRRITQSGGRAFLLANLDQVQGRLDHSGRPGDVVVTMGAGRTHLIHDELHRRLLRDSAA